MPDLPDRPIPRWGDVWCSKCDCACEFDDTAGHKLFAKRDEEGFVRGEIYLRAYCHGAHEDVIFTFQQGRHNLRPKAIMVFQESPLKQIEEKKLTPLIEGDYIRLHDAHVSTNREGSESSDQSNPKVSPRRDSGKGAARANPAF